MFIEGQIRIFESETLVGSDSRILVRFRLPSIQSHIHAHRANVGQEVEASFALHQSVNHYLLLLGFAGSQ